MNKANKEWFESVEGNEIWTNAFGNRFGERVCVGITKEGCVNCGEHFVPTDKEINELQKDHLIQEYGTSDMKAIMRMEGFC